MSGDTSIEWADATWNPVTDLFHDEVTDRFIAEVWAVMSLSPSHTFQILTKRPARMRALTSSFLFRVGVNAARMARGFAVLPDSPPGGPSWPLHNVWLGVSVESQRWANIRIPALLDTPAAVRFLSLEPLLGPVQLQDDWLLGWQCSGCGWRASGTDIDPALWRTGAREYDMICPACHCEGGFEDWHPIGWVIVGGESGPGARPMHPAWARSIRDQCVAAGVPFHFKQWGEWRWAADVDDIDAERALKASGLPDPFETHSCYTVGLDGSYSNTEPPKAGNASMMRVGKRSAGRELDGRTWDEYPAVRA